MFLSVIVYLFVQFFIGISLTLPYLTSRVERLLYLPSAEAVSVRPSAHLWM